MNDLENRRVLSIVSHASLLFSSTVAPILVPVVILLVSTDPIVKENAKEAINFGINIIVYGAICWALTFLLIGFVLIPLLVLFSIVLPIIAVVKIASEAQNPYRYPFIWRVL